MQLKPNTLLQARRPILPAVHVARVTTRCNSNSCFQAQSCLPVTVLRTANTRLAQRKLVVKAQQVAEQVISLYESISKGSPSPLGPSKQGTAVNFALFSRHASSVTLCLFDDNNKPVTEIPLEPTKHRTGDVWHVALDGLPGSGVCYGYKVGGDGGWSTGNRWDPSIVLLDPYAPLVSGRQKWATRDAKENFRHKLGSQWLGTFDFESEPFDWGNEYSRPNHHLKDLVVYEMPVHSFTAAASSGLEPGLRGTYLGVAEKAEYLKSLNISAVELLPVFEYDELEFQRYKNPRDHMVNIWGYSHINFFAPMSRFAANAGGPVAAVREFKTMVKTLHQAGIEVILDVVYNHTAESDDKDPYVISFRGVDNQVYYMTDPNQYVQLINHSGCGNTVNANHPVVMQLILDSLVHWVQEYHVDGFRFDLASCLCRDGRGHPIAAPPLIREISKHPVLSKVKLIAEPWDISMYQVGKFPNWDIWAEWNGIYRDDIRRFIKGDAGMKGALATRMCGSADLYHNHNRRPYHSINYVTAHDGFSMLDLVSYSRKYTEANGEGGNDGTNDNLSWNCGAEGPTGDHGVNVLRSRQIRNFFVALMLAQGTPMIVMGDEVMKTHKGNNNWYGHDSDLTHLHWEPQNNAKEEMRRFLSELVGFRRSCPLLGRENFLGPQDITWHEDNWQNTESRFLAWTLHDRGQGCGDVYVAFNSHGFSIDVRLPPAPQGRKWARLVDTNLPAPKDITPGGNSGVDSTYGVQAFSCIVLIAKPL